MRLLILIVFVLTCCNEGVYNLYLAKRSIALPPSCDSLIYCQGDLLHVIQMARLRDDSKTFVDHSLKHDVQTTLNNFYDMMNETNHKPNQTQLQIFIDDNFINEAELDDWTPTDFNPEPKFLEKIQNETVKNFAKDIVAIWPDLGRKIKDNVSEHPERHSIIYVPNGFIIPGGRFKEYYYWDSYWIIKGLLISEMTSTAKGMIENFLYIVDKYGHIPNGGRVYYLQRSQPPLLSYMAKDYYEKTKDLAWIKENIATLEKEVEFWLNNRMITINVNGQDYEIAIHNARSAGPRPESYYEDIYAAEMYSTEDEKNDLFIQLKSAAESGWDFSSRWIFDEYDGTHANISYTKTNRVAPVDLNSYIHGAFKNLALFYTNLNDVEKRTYWQQKASEINKTINEILWNQQDGIWYDFDIKTMKHRRYFAATNLAPLWTKAYNTEPKSTEALIHCIVEYLKKENIMDYYGGIPVTTDYTREQWDFPNAWPCIQAVVVNGLEDSDTAEGKKWAKDFATRWVIANMIGYNETNAMFEKYDAENPGKVGGGGEYNTQKGFGWTNGVVLEFIKKYYSEN